MHSKCKILNKLNFEIRVFSLVGRLPSGIAVANARDFLSKHGGVKIYDNGFELPYYGLEHDWLDIEVDHSHRLSASKFLPSSLQVPGGLSNLPTQTRLLGYVFVDTTYEASAARGATDIYAKSMSRRNVEYLQIQVSRDRLADNAPYRILRDCVRYALDWYAMRETLRRIREVEKQAAAVPRPADTYKTVDQIIERHAAA